MACSAAAERAGGLDAAKAPCPSSLKILCMAAGSARCWEAAGARLGPTRRGSAGPYGIDARQRGGLPALRGDCPTPPRPQRQGRAAPTLRAALFGVDARCPASREVASVDKVHDEDEDARERGGVVAQPDFSGRRLAEARRAAGLTEEDLAGAIGVSSGLRIRAWESGEAERPRPRFIPLLAEALGIDPLSLLDVDPEDPPLVALRVAAGKAIQDVCNELGMALMNYQRLESGIVAYELDESTAVGLADAFGVTAARVRAALRRSRVRAT